MQPESLATMQDHMNALAAHTLAAQNHMPALTHIPALAYTTRH